MSYILSNVSGHLWPPIVLGYKLKGFPPSCMTSDLGVMVLGYYSVQEIRVVWDVDLPLEV